MKLSELFEGKSLIKPNQFDRTAREMKYHNTMDKAFRNMGARKKVRAEKVVIRDTHTGKIYGRRTIMQKAT